MDEDARLLRSLTAPTLRSRSASPLSRPPSPLPPPTGAAATYAARRDAVAAHAASLADDPLTSRPLGFGPVAGPRGVVADAAWAGVVASRRHERAVLEAIAPVHPSPPSDRDAATAARDDDDNNDDNDDDDDDASFLAQHRAARLASLRLRAAAVPPGPHGTLATLPTADAFLSLLEGAPAATLVLVLLYEDWAPGCEEAVSDWGAWAAAHPRHLCGAMRSGAASESFDPIARPAVLAYRGGDLLGSALRVGRGSGGVARAVAGALASVGVQI